MISLFISILNHLYFTIPVIFFSVSRRNPKGWVSLLFSTHFLNFQNLECSVIKVVTIIWPMAECNKYNTSNNKGTLSCERCAILSESTHNKCSTASIGPNLVEWKWEFWSSRILQFSLFYWYFHWTLVLVASLLLYHSASHLCCVICRVKTF